MSLKLCYVVAKLRNCRVPSLCQTSLFLKLPGVSGGVDGEHGLGTQIKDKGLGVMTPLIRDMLQYTHNIPNRIGPVPTAGSHPHCQ